jgi:hypothetical protein
MLKLFPRLINLQIFPSLVFIFFAFLTFQSDMSFIIKLGRSSFILFLMKIERITQKITINSLLLFILKIELHL